MFKSFFSKLAITYIAIMLVVMVFFSYTITLLYERSAFEDKKESLLAAANQVQRLTADYYAGNLPKEELNQQLDTIGYIMDSRIYTIKITKSGLRQSKSLQIAGLEGEEILQDLETVLDNQVVFQKRRYFQELDTYVVMLSKPLVIDNQVEGAILFLTPVSKLGNKIDRVRLLIFGLAGTMALAGMLIIYLNAGRISKPIRRLEQAALQLAAGDLPMDIEISSEDEIGSLAKSFNYMKNKLAETEQIRRDFIANVSHDLRTPLTTINGFIQGMLDGLIKPENSKRYLEIMSGETARLTRLTGDILELAKLESENILLHREYKDIQKILTAAVESMETTAAEKGISVSVECPSMSLYIDEDRMKQILTNVISNAIKYSDEGCAVYLKGIEDVESVKLIVKDTGNGIPEQDLPYIFEKFYRADKSRHAENYGTGLGLSIVKKLVGLHGGTIKVRSQLGAGTEFIIELPKGNAL